MPPELIVKVVGDTSGLERSFSRAGKQAQSFDRNVRSATKGAVVGAVSFRNLGRSLAFATGGFVAFAGVSEILRKSVDAARDASVAQKSLAAQLHANGESFKASGAAIQQAGLSLGKFGFTTEDSAHALTVLDRATGSITKAISLQGFTANLARAKNLDLASAAAVVGKVFGGQETALRRSVPGLAKNAHGLDLIREASAKLKGQASANTTEAQRFNAILHDTEVIVGTALLPTLDKFLSSLGKWLDKMNRTGRLQKDVNSAVKTGTHVFEGIKGVVEPLAGAFKTLGDAVGGTKNEVKLLVAAFAAFKLTKLISGLNLIGTSAATSASKVGLLRGALLRLGALGVITVGIELIANRKGIDKAVSGFLDKHGLPGGANTLTPQQVLQQAGSLSNTFGSKTANELVGGALKDLFAPFANALARISRASGSGRGASTVGQFQVPGTVAGRTLGTLTPEQKIQLGLAQNPNSLDLLGRQATFDRKQIAFLQRLHAQGKGPAGQKFVNELKGFYDDLTSSLSQIASIQDAAAAKAKAARDRAAAAFRKAIPGNVSGSGQVGPGAFGVRVPGRVGGTGPFGIQSFAPSLGLQLAAAKASTTLSSADDLTIVRKIKNAALKALRSGKLAITGQIDAYNAIADANDKLRQNITGDVTKFKHVSTSKLLAGLDLTPEQLRAARERLATVGSAGSVPSSTRQFAGTHGVVITGPVHIHGVQNLAQFEDQLEKRARSRPQVRRGAR